MSGVYVDTSALLKRYVPERGSDAFDAFFIERSPVGISRLTLVEVRSGLARRRREKQLTPKQERAAMDQVHKDILDGVLVVEPGADAHLVEAFHLIDKLPGVPLRTLDAMHLAIARHTGARILATADRIQADAAEALGMAVERFFKTSES